MCEKNEYTYISKNEIEKLNSKIKDIDEMINIIVKEIYNLKRKVENEHTKQYEFLVDKYKKIYNDLLILKLDMQKTKQRLIDNVIKYLVIYTIILLFVIYFIISYS